MSNITLSQEALNKLIMAAVKSAMAGGVPAKGAKDANGKSAQTLKNEAKVIKAFKKAGYPEIKLHEDVKTFDKWLAEGRRVKAGEKSVRVPGVPYRLFHKDQTEVSDSAAEILAKKQAAYKAKTEANVVPLR